MTNLLLTNRIHYVGLGDRLDVLGVAKHLSEQGRVKILQPRGWFRQLDELVDLFDLDCFYYHGKPVDHEEYHLHDPDGDHAFYDDRDFIRLSVDLDLELPEKFVTVQFDGTHGHNRIRNPKKIISEWRERGYDIIHVGGQATDDRFAPKAGNLKNIAYAMSKSQGHIGVDSGMMHLAKFSMDADKICVYTVMERKTSFVHTLERKGALVLTY